RQRRAVGRDGDGDGPAGLGRPGDRRPLRARADGGGADLPPGSRLRADGGEARRAGRADRAARGPAEAALRSPRRGPGARPGGRRAVNAAATGQPERPVITLALSKGRILDETAVLLERCGIALDPDLADSRKLILPTRDPGLRLLIVRATDVPTYVQHGAADIGIAGRDVMLEHGGEGLYQP